MIDRHQVRIACAPSTCHNKGIEKSNNSTHLKGEAGEAGARIHNVVCVNLLRQNSNGQTQELLRMVKHRSYYECCGAHREAGRECACACLCVCVERTRKKKEARRERERERVCVLA